MRSDRLRASAPFLSGLIVGLVWTGIAVAENPSKSFDEEIRPIFARHCLKCHGPEKRQGGLQLDQRRSALQGGESGEPAIVPRDPERSRLLHLVTSTDETERMPPQGERLSPREIDILRRWIESGAEWAGGDVPATNPTELQVTDEDRRHWAFVPLSTVEPPQAQDREWNRNPVDKFIRQAQAAQGIRPAPPADARTLLRRIQFNLIGLPPTPEETAAFERAAASDLSGAVDELTDRLLASPHYGERWGRHWLDVARYADSDGQESDRDRPNAYHYRDFVIRAFNDDMPFDQFVRWQLAGDEYEPNVPDAVAATGFLTSGPIAALPDRLMADERLRERYNELDDILSTIGTGLLGLTLGCCRCHDHKYDAVPSRDYYSLMSAWHSGNRAEIPLGTKDRKALGFRDFGPEPKPTWLFRRGDYHDHDEPVELGFLTVLTKDRSPRDYWEHARERSPAKESTKQRRAVGDWITDVEQGAGALLARVFVNRIWQYHFGHGLVRSVGDFGTRAEPPSHPELLEWLAHDFVSHGWQVKRLHKLILSTSVYRQSGRGAEIPAADPDNRLLWRMPLRRIEGEILRDSMLAVSGTLNLASYGPAVKPPIAAEAMLARNLKDPYPGDLKDGPDVRRRSIYLFHKRVVPNPLLQAFDKPDAQQTCGRRDNTTVAPQALALLNDRFVRQVSLDFADRLLKESGPEAAAAIASAYRLAIGREPTEPERAAGLEFLERQTQARAERNGASPDDAKRRALADFCQVVFGLNEFIYVD